MSVEIYDPSHRPEQSDPAMLLMTPRAIAHVKRQSTRMSGRSLRLGIKESGCSGYMYQLDFVDEPAPNDVAVQIDDDLSVFVDGQHLPLMRGTEIDYVTEGLNSTLKFRNPNAEAECGCGESFSVRNQTPA
jgi:iron-sulfur cluster assembly accessory protein